MFRRLFSISLLVLLLCASFAHADLSIIVKYDRGWGGAPTSNIKALCENVALHFQEQFRDEYKIDG